MPEIDDVIEELLARQPESDMVPTLDRVAAVMELMGDPQKSLQVVHITGTNGKTSTARMIEAMLRGAGLRTGLFTSPHLLRITERICLDGEEIGEEEFVAAYEDIRPLVAIVDAAEDAEDRPGLTFFEVLTCLAFAAFADAPVDVAVMEVGLGGRWDATNVADGRVNVVSPISLDHTQWLGDTLEQIAQEKAGIIKPGSVAVMAEQHPRVLRVLQDRCREVGARGLLWGGDFGLLSRSVAVGGQVLDIRGVEGEYSDIFLPLTGAHQGANAAVAVVAVESLLVDGVPLDTGVVDALGGVVNTGRLETVMREPTVIVDAAHNPAGVGVLAAAIADSYHFTDLVVVLSVMADKDIPGILRELEPLASLLVVTRNSSPRAASPEYLAGLAVEQYGDGRVLMVPEVDRALEEAVAVARERGGGVLVTGSVVTAADGARWAAEDAEADPR